VSTRTAIVGTSRAFSVALTASGTAVALGSLLPWISVKGGLFGTVNLERLDDDAALFVAIGAILTLIGVAAATHGPTRLGGIAALCIAATTTMIWYLDLTETLEAIDMVNSPLEPFARGGMGLGPSVLAVGLWVGFVGAGGIASRSVHSGS